MNATLNILCTRKRSGQWVAWLQERPNLMHVGRTQEEAIGCCLLRTLEVLTNWHPRVPLDDPRVPAVLREGVPHK